METLVYGLALVVLLAIMARQGAFRAVTAALDRRAEAIREEIERSNQLRHEAQTLLKDYQRDLAAAEKDRLAIAEKAKADAESYAETRRAAVARAVDNQVKMGRERVAQEERRARRRWREKIMDIAVGAAGDVISGSAGSHHAKSAEESIEMIAKSLK